MTLHAVWCRAGSLLLSSSHKRKSLAQKRKQITKRTQNTQWIRQGYCPFPVRRTISNVTALFDSNESSKIPHVIQTNRWISCENRNAIKFTGRWNGVTRRVVRHICALCEMLVNDSLVGCELRIRWKLTRHRPDEDPSQQQMASTNYHSISIHFPQFNFVYFVCGNFEETFTVFKSLNHRMNVQFSADFTRIQKSIIQALLHLYAQLVWRNAHTNCKTTK